MQKVFPIVIQNTFLEKEFVILVPIVFENLFYSKCI